MISKEVKEYAAAQISLGYQKDTTPEQQRIASVFSVVYTQFLEYELTDDIPFAVCEPRRRWRILSEEKTTDGRR